MSQFLVTARNIQTDFPSRNIHLSDATIMELRYMNNRGWSKTRQRKLEKEARMLRRHGRTPQQQLYELDFRLGKDIGATKERARLRKYIQAA